VTDETGPPEEPVDSLQGDAGTFADSAAPDITMARDDGELDAEAEAEGEARADGGARADSGSLPPLPAALEAVLLVTDEPVPAVTLAQVTERPTDEVEATLEALAAEYVHTGRGFELRQVAGGWRLYTRPDCAPYVERFVLDGQSARLTQAALETLAVIAYRQPVTRGRVSAVRGVNVDGVIRTLLSRGLISESGHDEDTGGILYRTTPLLLERLGLQSLTELPSLGPLLPELDDLDSAQPST
jgi:segregation and condensation protein B